jgi:hypothetical protein
MSRSPCLLLAFAISLPSNLARAQVSASASVPGNSSGTDSATGFGPYAASASLTADVTNQYLSQGSAAAAASDLTAGTMRAYATGMGIMASASGGPPSAPTAQANIIDSLTIAGSGSSTQATMTMDIGGAFRLDQAGSSAGEATQTAIGRLDFGDQSLTIAIFHNWTKGTGGNPDQDVVSVSPMSDPRVVVTGLTSGDLHITVTEQTTVSVGQPVGVFAFLAVATTDLARDIQSTWDFGGTAHLGLQLPAGFTFTSQSGAFLARAGDPGLQLDGGDSPGGFGTTSSGGTTGGATTSSTGGGNGGGSSNGTSGGTTSGIPDGGSTGSHSGGCASGGSAPGGAVSAVILGALLLLAVRRSKRPSADSA